MKWPISRMEFSSKSNGVAGAFMAIVSLFPGMVTGVDAGCRQRLCVTRRDRSGFRSKLFC
jgi:hypothetical protein